MSTASVFFHRFYMRRALPRDVRERAHDTFTFQEMAPTCIFLACKVEETHRKLHGVVEATMAVLDRSPAGIELAETRSYKPDVQSKVSRLPGKESALADIEAGIPPMEGFGPALRGETLGNTLF